MEKRGRPTDYDPSFCNELILHMEQGLSFESFAGVVRCTKSTLYRWLNHNSDFSDAKHRGVQLCRLWWERLGIQGVQGFGPECVKKRKVVNGVEVEVEYAAAQFNVGAWIFNMKNRFPEEWRERPDLPAKDDLLAELAASPEAQKKLAELLAQANPAVN